MYKSTNHEVFVKRVPTFNITGTRKSTAVQPKLEFETSVLTGQATERVFDCSSPM